MQLCAPSSKIVEYILQSCGYGSVLELNDGADSIIPKLIGSGVNAKGVQSVSPTVDFQNPFPERYVISSFLHLPFSDNSFATVAAIGCLEMLDTKDIPIVLNEICRVSSRFAFLHLRLIANASPERGRAWWENKCFEAGFRKHPNYYQINPYEALNDDGDEILIALEKVPPAALKQYDLMVLSEERLLHTDMLRETGRRSDAHCIRYHKAAEYIRLGDRVLDVACGLGYGSHILYSNSKAHCVTGIDLSEFSIDYAKAHYDCTDRLHFAVGDAQDLSNIPSKSIDFITAFETIEHVPDPDAYLKELKRVLKPSGRLMVCAPNNWVDETGKDPNPFHLHVYTWERLINECGSYFLLEKGFFQTAGGALRYHHSPRSWVEVLPQKASEQNGEWVLLLCMADPTNGDSAPYKETAWYLPNSRNFNVLAFGRDYDNPWLVKGMVAIGMRAQSEVLLNSMHENVLLTSPHMTVDFGAALCGHIYTQLRRTPLPEAKFTELHESILTYANIPNPTPHQLRWQVSLLFAGGELARQHGKTEIAKKFYKQCAEIDVISYSPLLGNKTLGALYWLAIFAVADNNIEEARIHLEVSIKEAIRLVSSSWLNIIGDPRAPLPFGFPEVAQIMDKAARAVYMLTSLDDSGVRPGLIYRESAGFFERQLATAQTRIEELESASIDFIQKVISGDKHAQELAKQIICLDEHPQSLAKIIVELNEDIHHLTQQVEHRNALIKETSVNNKKTTALMLLIAHRIMRKTADLFLKKRL
ncbi:class I SAM-dependent methyltransferase [Brucella sp. 10RB9213]|uniref:class I SAM-dependent methyltransferase n=1 Tax=Brucella sp. 10RB9213 TaxID=1844039 RepID=UPI0012AE48E5|nr:class I SAM-dependent methyltransferase [Brucella sp. 10RB9213]MRN67754.1 methyltransferase domain-containing protein [Brucella sp. 10RB9213]